MWDCLRYYPGISQWLPRSHFLCLCFRESLFLGSCFPLIYSLALLNHIFQWHLEQEYREEVLSGYPRAVSSSSVPWEAGIYGDNIGSLLAFWLPVDFGQWEMQKLSGRKRRKSRSLFSSSLLFELWAGGWPSPLSVAVSYGCSSLSLGNSALWQLSLWAAMGNLTISSWLLR